MPHDLDAEIAQLQQRLRLDRIALALSVEATLQTLRERLTSPVMLLTAAGTGFLLGRATRGHRSGVFARGRWRPLLIEAANTAFKLASSPPAVWLIAMLRGVRAPRTDSRDSRSGVPQ